jgi:histidinol dehydrogenase
MAVMQIIENPEKTRWPELLARPVYHSVGLDASVRKIMEDVKSRGDKAVNEYTEKFDQVRIGNAAVPLAGLDGAEKLLGENLKAAIRLAKKNITTFHRNQIMDESKIETMPGIHCWRRSVAIEKVGLYIPGGTAPLFSTLLMLGVPATLAGCEEIIICTPPMKDGTVHPAILYTANLLGIRKIYLAGGVQAIAAMGYGTETMPAVYKIFGPGNQFVTHAKKIIQQEGIAIDMPAGPSELAIYADETAVPAYVAADLLSQCEHGPDSQVMLIAATRSLAEKVNAELEKQMGLLSRKDIAERSLGNSRIVMMPDPSTAIDLLNVYAPEHLILACRDAEIMALRVRNAGSVFIGNFTPESAGDYASGTNHTLPTNGFAKAYSGISVESFMKKISFQQMTKQGLESIGDAIIEMSTAEGLDAHAAAVKIRLEEFRIS